MICFDFYSAPVSVDVLLVVSPIKMVPVGLAMIRAKRAPEPDKTVVWPAPRLTSGWRIWLYVCNSVQKDILKVSISSFFFYEDNEIMTGKIKLPIFFPSEDLEEKTCVPCESNCASCQERPDHCTSCHHNLVLSNNKCLATCPPNTYETDSYRYDNRFEYVVDLCIEC